MDSRERVGLTLEFHEPDRVPVDFWGSKGFYKALEARTGQTKEAFLAANDIDFRYIEGPRYIGPPLPSLPDGASADIWGVMRRSVRVPTAFGEEVYSEVAAHPLAEAATVEQIESYAQWPSPDWFDYTPVRAQCQAVRNKGRVVIFMGDRLNRVAQLKPAMYLRGIEQILVDLLVDPDISDAIFKRLRTFYGEYLSRILEAADGLIDIVLTGDDFGSQNGPLLSPASWERFLADGFEQYVGIARAHGARAMHHTCGGVTPLVSGMVERGLDVLQSLQPEAMADDFHDLKARYRGQLSFQGGISIQQTLPHGTVEDVREEVRRRIEVLGPGGGYILGTAHNIQSDCPPENVDALLQAYREMGSYRQHLLPREEKV